MLSLEIKDTTFGHCELVFPSSPRISEKRALFYPSGEGTSCLEVPWHAGFIVATTFLKRCSAR